MSRCSEEDNSDSDSSCSQSENVEKENEGNLGKEEEKLQRKVRSLNIFAKNRGLVRIDLKINEGIKVSRSSSLTRYFENHRYRYSRRRLYVKILEIPNLMKICILLIRVICKSLICKIKFWKFRTKVKKFRTKVISYQRKCFQELF